MDPGEKNLPLLLQEFERATFQSQVQRSNHWAIPTTEKQPNMHTQSCEYFFFFAGEVVADSSKKKLTEFYKHKK